MNLDSIKCPKCGCEEYETKKISVTGSGISKLMDIQSNKYIAVSCKDCGFTEFYKGKTKFLANLLDLLIK